MVGERWKDKRGSDQTKKPMIITLLGVEYVLRITIRSLFTVDLIRAPILYITPPKNQKFQISI